MKLISAALTLLLAGSLCLADVLVLHDGRRLEGKVKDDGSTYVIEMRFGSTRIPHGQVQEWIKGDSPEAATQPPAAADPPNRPASAPPQPVPPATPPDVQTQIDDLKQRASEYEAMREYGNAAQLYERALRLKPGDAELTIRAACAYDLHGNPARARTLVETLRGREDADQRATCMMIARLDLRLGKPSRAIATMAELAQSLEEPDEQVLNALGTLLSKLDDDHRRTRAYRDAVQAYEVNNRLLEQQRPGRRRWGSRWVSQAEYAHRLAAFQAAVRKVEQRRQRVEELDREISAAEKEARNAASTFQESRAAKARARAKELRREREAAIDAYTKAKREVPWPPFPDEIARVEFRLPSNQPAGAVTADAVASIQAELSQAELEQLSAQLRQDLDRLEDGMAASPSPSEPEVTTVVDTTPTDIAVAGPVSVSTPQPAATPASSQRPQQVRPLREEIKVALPNGLELKLEQVALHKVDLNETARRPAKKASLFSFDEEESFTAATPMTAIRVRITNTTQRPVEYLGLNGIGDLPAAWLSDRGPTSRRWMPAEFTNGTVRDAIERRTLAPGESCTDLLVFPPDAIQARRLTLHISGLGVGSDRRTDIPIP